ncbi:MAG: ShlB/FhaC/HecB family hemolysin secretion/activation protein [Alphaproteobacteria bacterium]|nr:ShlB/FhaC/HecB family hemolysin secretion/activation protein [Alphaproteobacteria bacterium]
MDGDGTEWRRGRPARASVIAIGLLVLLFGLNMSAHGQAVDIPPLISPPLPGVVPPPQPQVAPPPPIPPARPSAPLPQGPPVRIDAVRVEGVTVYAPEAIAPLYAELVGATVPRERLDAVIDDLQTKYRTDGYILTVVRGEIRLVNGRTVFVLRAVEGYISEVKLDGDIGPAGTLVYEFLHHLTWIRPVNNADLERYLLLVQDIPGVSVRAVLRRTPEPGAVELVAQLSRKPFSAFAQYDNLGSNEAGPNEMLLRGSSNSFTRFGEQFEAIFFNTFNREELFGQVDASAFLGAEGLRLAGYWGRGNSLPGGALTGTGFVGDYTVAGLAFSYPAIRSRRLNIIPNISFDYYDSSVDVNSPNGVPTQLNSGHLRMMRAGGTLDFQDAVVADLPAANLVILKVSQGLPGLGASSNQEVMPPRVGNRTDFTKFAGEVTRVQNLVTFGEVGTALKLSLGGQYTGDILPPSEKFFCCGLRWSRGYFYGQVTGDRGIGTTVELQLNTGFTDVPILAPDQRLDVQFYGFYDFGRFYNLAPGEFNQTVDSFGIGARSNLTSWLFVDLAGIRRLVTQPNGANVSRVPDYALFSRVAVQY